MRKITGLMPADCDRLTLTEIEFTLADNRCPDGRPIMTDAEIDDKWLWWQGLTAEERLEFGEL